MESEPEQIGSAPVRRFRLAHVMIPITLPICVGAAVALLHADWVTKPAGLEPIATAIFEPLGPESADGDPTPVALPHTWKLHHEGLRRARYRMAFERPHAPEGAVAAYFTGVDGRVEVRVNGHRVGSQVDVPASASRLWLVPLYRPLPEALLVAGTNQLEIEITGSDAGTGFLSPAYVGTESALLPAFELRRFLQVSAIQILVVAFVSVGAFLALLSLRRRKDTSYFWFGVVTWVFAFGFWNLLALDTRIPMPPYSWVGAVTMAWLLAAIVVFVHRLLGERRPRIERGLALCVLAGSVYFAVTLDTPAFDAMIPVWGAAVLLVGLYPAARLAARFVRRPDRELSLTVAAGVIAIAAGIHDVALVNGLLPLGHDFAIQYAAWSSLGIFSFLFVTRFIDALDTSEALTVELSARVEAKAAEIAASHARVRVLEQQHAVTRERERILSELHDGMGGQLVSALAILRSSGSDENGEAVASETADTIQAALDDLRLMIDSLDDVEGDLGTLLGSLRARMGRRLERSGLVLDWRIGDAPQPAGFGPEAALQLMRIVQEAITNVIKHAAARSISVSTRAERAGARRCAVLEIRDDGCGFDAARSDGGRGLGNMRRRAQRIGAELVIDTDRAGTRIRLVLPAPEDPGADAAGEARPAD
jgi:signal transduction histidine kinase